METDSTVMYRGPNEQRSSPDKSQDKSMRMQFSAEELRVIRECNRESFYQRSLPLAIAGMAVTYLGVKKGYLAPHPKLGPGLKMTAAGVAGWFLGKIAYRSVCEEKLMKLENSVIGDALRKKRGRGSDMFGSDVSFSESDCTTQGVNASGHLSDGVYHSSSGSLNLDVDKNVQYSGFDDRERPSTDNNQTFATETEPISRSATTYDDLRMRNREEYEKQFPHSQTSRSVPQPSYTPIAQKTWTNYDTLSQKRVSPDSNEGNTKNTYGDSWDNPKFS